MKVAVYRFVYNINLPGTEDRYARFTIVNDKYTLKEKLNYNSNQEVFFKFISVATTPVDSKIMSNWNLTSS